MACSVKYGSIKAGVKGKAVNRSVEGSHSDFVLGNAPVPNFGWETICLFLFVCP
jgi:hypothetical protein